ncbi:MerR family transcriptional regulator [Actinoplanes sp. SE50]|uniref:MerR family transcriptional regulator n=1 Tax=unclassified Actinoplanes TaxID=2626549 RepID=UPI00023EDCAB|nr:MULTISPECIES: MerR family transcriptional regulator [unclassified Actinoplanes]AEV88514.1 DNA polymerase III subunit beta [Actinoplanes sp. SE50/110]ATO86919.1 MerR family transcriptional regulator [Actinoplanes sp. SE50]SLM04337.1 MerR family transcriptional regulator [Actinoplanes sp. SE50/110]
MRTIGAAARASGLTVSALRFYDSAGVLVPAVVDPDTGYRRYSAEQIRAARLIAGLRRVGMPVAEISRAVADLGHPDRVRDRLDAHLARLEAGLADARTELLRLHTLLDLEEHLMTRITLSAADLRATLAAVRFATTDPIPGTPFPGGVLLEAADGTLTLVATDRYRLAVAATPAAVEGSPARHYLPLDFVDRLLGLTTGTVTLDVDDDSLRATAGDLDLRAAPVAADFPDYRRLVPGPGRRIGVDPAELRELLADAPEVHREHDGATYPVTILAEDPDGGLRLAAESEWSTDAGRHVAVNREFLLQAADAGGPGQLLLELDGPVRPLIIRSAADESRFSLLMPVRG